MHHKRLTGSMEIIIPLWIWWERCWKRWAKLKKRLSPRPSPNSQKTNTTGTGVELFLFEVGLTENEIDSGTFSSEAVEALRRHLHIAFA